MQKVDNRNEKIGHNKALFPIYIVLTIGKVLFKYKGLKLA